MSLFKQMSHVSITVTDVQRARDFYTGMLGFEEIPRPAFDFTISPNYFDPGEVVGQLTPFWFLYGMQDAPELEMNEDGLTVGLRLALSVVRSRLGA